ncbi:dihydropteroate synthase [Paenimyroides tangerinum]|uniref:Dihydropteroate synthase n=1 Tax=Paenimyroides tangerinum TaxID=2488728 RepID=A0A3P3W4M2_9FLAO|nr:dihydropteroate synthase [Paenimyroides tangerinum]RRJ90035.1 dihydropteroate synthase [Paenimyroides tangerinum]
MTINCNGKLMDFEVPKVMGILNCTPNSFYDGGKYKTETDFLKQTEKMLIDGASIIDLGAYSTQPNADFVTEEEELNRILPIASSIIKHFPEVILSIDSFRSEVAKQCIENGATIINDVSAGFLDEKMFEVVGKYKVPYIMMHMKGTPQNMQKFTDYDDVMKDMMFYFSERIATAKSFGIVDIILDPGFGFSKTLNQNYEVLNKLELLNEFNLPVLSALSRKSMIYKFLNTEPTEVLNGTTVLHTISLMKGAKLLRAHDVKEAVECVKLTQKIYENN